MKFSIFFPYTYLSAPPPRCCRELEQEACFEKEGNLPSVACEIPNRNERECCAYFADKKGKKPAWKNSDQIVFEYNKFTNKVIKDCRENIESAQSLWNHSQCWHNVVLLLQKCLTNYKNILHIDRQGSLRGKWWKVTQNSSQDEYEWSDTVAPRHTVSGDTRGDNIPSGTNGFHQPSAILQPFENRPGTRSISSR